MPDHLDLQAFVDDVQAGRFRMVVGWDGDAGTVSASVTCAGQFFAYAETDRPYMPRVAAEAKAILGVLRYVADALNKAVVETIVTNGATR